MWSWRPSTFTETSFTLNGPTRFAHNHERRFRPTCFRAMPKPGSRTTSAGLATGASSGSRNGLRSSTSNWLRTSAAVRSRLTRDRKRSTDSIRSRPRSEGRHRLHRRGRRSRGGECRFTPGSRSTRLDLPTAAGASREYTPARSADRHLPEAHCRRLSILSPAVTATGTTVCAA